jgi:hypothetical protein
MSAFVFSASLVHIRIADFVLRSDRMLVVSHCISSSAIELDRVIVRMNDVPAEPFLCWNPISIRTYETLGYRVLTNVCSLYAHGMSVLRCCCQEAYLPALDLRFGALGAARFV